MRYALLDTARLGYEITAAQAINPNHVSLYRGPEDPQMTDMAPMLLWYETNDPFDQWLNQHWGDAQGIGIVTSVPPDELRKHLRRFLLVATDDGQQLYFRYYDPRILKVFLPTCDQEQIRTFFGPVETYEVEDPDNDQTMLFAHQNGKLVQTVVKRPISQLVNDDDRETEFD